MEHRQITGIGTESPDVELTHDGEIKLLLAKKGHFSVVQLANVDLLPFRGFTVTISPLKLQNGTGGPTRVFAVIENRKKKSEFVSSDHHQKKDEEYCENYIKYKRQHRQEELSQELEFHSVAAVLVPKMSLIVISFLLLFTK